jgi:hypothetical protein
VRMRLNCGNVVLRCGDLGIARHWNYWASPNPQNAKMPDVDVGSSPGI